ncbi:hypothetical protein CEXT_398361 [Caerostris extrusa]|uniref:Uncharacterized protein n=1 Tax=Caerostris extrusa TaxID=172846 RepID=A0AAV4RRP8_CAEEX|nr:hypothetical protein CEXT_398361 [Caerostris extrusa]
MRLTLKVNYAWFSILQLDADNKLMALNFEIQIKGRIELALKTHTRFSKDSASRFWKPPFIVLCGSPPINLPELVHLYSIDRNNTACKFKN